MQPSGSGPSRLEARDGTEDAVFFQLAGAGAAGGPGPATAGGNDNTWSPSGGHPDPVASDPVASVPAVPLPLAHPVIPPFQFTRSGPAAEVPDEVIRPVHDLEVRRLRAPRFVVVLAWRSQGYFGHFPRGVCGAVYLRGCGGGHCA